MDEARFRQLDAHDRCRRRALSADRPGAIPRRPHGDPHDIDIGAREQAERHGLTFRRIASLNDDPDLIEALAAIANRTLKAGHSAVLA
jgi:hypothetical protein